MRYWASVRTAETAGKTWDTGENGEKYSSGSEQAAERGQIVHTASGKLASGAKAHADFARFAARLKSCPDASEGSA